MHSYTERRLGPIQLTSGITRIAIIGRKYVVKIPNVRYNFWRGWIANQSEWQQRDRADALRPLATLFHVFALYPKAWCPTEEDFAACPVAEGSIPGIDYTGDEEKVTSWGEYRGEWLLIDFDRSWERRSRIAKLYYANQDRKSRKWARL